MGMWPDTFEFATKAARIAGHDSWKGVRMVELGCQQIHGFPSEIMALKHAKGYFESLKATHISIDLNGKRRSVPLDLTKPIPFVPGWFDLLTNLGTSEHIAGSDQYQVFENIHRFVRPRGTILHTVPSLKTRHGTVQYGDEFFHQLAHLAGYTVRHWGQTEACLARHHKYLAVILQQPQEARPFCTRELFEELRCEHTRSIR